MAQGRKDFKIEAQADVAPVTGEQPRNRTERSGERAGANRLSGARTIALDRLQLDENRLRTTVDASALRKLADSIALHGVIHPLTVVYDDVRDIYIIVNGARRFMAARQAGLTAVPCLVKESVGDSHHLQQLVENIHREDLPVLAEAEAIQELCQTFKLSQREAARRIGKPKSYVNELLKLLRLPADVKERIVRKPDIAKTSLLKLARLNDPEKIHSLFIQLETNTLSTKQLVQHQDYPEKEKRGRPTHYRFSYTPANKRYSLTIKFPRHRVKSGDVIKALRETLVALQESEE